MASPANLPLRIYKLITAVVVLVLVSFIVVTAFAGGDGGDRNVPGATTGPGKSSANE